MAATMTSVSTRSTALAAPIACGCCMLAGAAYVVAENPADGGAFLPCPFRTLTGWWCPGCGLTRATHHLFRGDIVQALRHHVFVVFVLGGIGMAWLTWMCAAAGRPLARPRAVPAWAPVVAVVVLVAFAVVRNVAPLPLTG